MKRKKPYTASSLCRKSNIVPTATGGVEKEKLMHALNSQEL